MKPTAGYIKALKYVSNPKLHCPLKSTTKIGAYPYVNNTQKEKQRLFINHGQWRRNSSYGYNKSNLGIFENKNRF